MFKIIKDTLTGPSDTDIIFMLRILIGMLEHSKDKYPIKRQNDFLQIVISLCEHQRTENLSQNILQTVSMFVWTHLPLL